MKFINMSLILISILSFNVYSHAILSEIGFNNDEFVEIYSNKTINFNNSIIFDENGYDNHNVLNLHKKINSSYYLIIGENFANNNNLDNLDCTIYITDKTQVGYRGLKNLGENFTIMINSSYNLSYYNNHEYDFYDNQSLNFKNDFYITNRSVCKNNFIKNINKSNENNVSENYNNSYNNVSENIYFNITTDNFLTFDKIEFDFITNVENFTIEYWIENYKDQIVKNKRNTTNLNTKRWTCKDNTDLFLIKANLYYKNYTFFNFKKFFYYNNISKEKSVKKSGDNHDDISYFEILNENDLINDKTDILKYKIYRGNTRKRSVYFYLNDKKQDSIQLSQNSYIKSDILFNFKEGKNIINVEGLNQSLDLIVYRKNINNNNNNDKENNMNSSNDDNNHKNSLEISNINNSYLYGSINLKFKERNLQCYVNYIRKKVSNVLNFKLENKNGFKLKINNSFLYELTNTNINELKLICKHKNSNAKTWQYLSVVFNYTINKSQSIVKKNNSKNNSNTYNQSKKINLNSVGSEYLKNNNDDGNYNNKTFNLKTLFKKEKSINNKTVNIKSNNILQKENSFFYFLGILVLLLIIFILKW